MICVVCMLLITERNLMKDEVSIHVKKIAGDVKDLRPSGNDTDFHYSFMLVIYGIALVRRS